MSEKFIGIHQFLTRTNNITFAVISCLLVQSVLAQSVSPIPNHALHLTARMRAEIFPHSGQYEVTEKAVELDCTQTALIICDLWDKHWCDGATSRVGIMAPRIDALAKNLRARGGLIVHAPSDTMAYYKDTPQRKLATDAPDAKTPVAFHWNYCDLSVEPPLPIDDSDGGCDTANKTTIAWTRQHPAVEVAAEDAVSDQGREIYNLFVQRGIRNVLFCGVHANMCVLGRSFGIREMRKLGVNPILVRDLTDTMYNPRSYPYVPHDRGTDLVVEHIEKYWCPSILSSDVLEDPKPLKIVFAIGEDEYHAKETLPAFAKNELESKLNCKCMILQSDNKADLPGLDALKDADLLVMFMRRRTLPDEQLKALVGYMDAGKPVVGIRTACHSFQNWLEFDATVFGSHYNNHYSANKGQVTITVAHSAQGNPILRGVAPTWQTSSSLYKMLPLSETCIPLLNGVWADKPAEPLAWTTKYRDGKVFFTSLGSPDDFKDRNFIKLLKNAIFWTVDKPIPSAGK